MITYLNWITIIVSVILCIKNIKNLANNSRYIIYFLFVTFYVVPIVLDIIYMKPAYISKRYIGFAQSQDDFWTNVIYNLFIIYAQLIILKWKNKDNSISKINNDNNNVKLIGTILRVFAIVPIILVLVFPVDKRIIYTFQWRELKKFEYTSFGPIIERMTYIGMCSSLMLLFKKENNIASRLLYALLVFLNVCIQGKRSILFFLLVSTIVVMIPGMRDKSIDLKERRKKIILLLVLSIVVVGIMIGYSLSVKINSRGYNANDVEILYTQLRIDMLRDDRVKMSIFSLLYPNEMKILDYWGQSLIQLPLFVFPLDSIFNNFGLKGVSYAAYFSAALENLPLQDSYTFMTPCLCAELTSNVGFVALLIYPFLCLKFADWSDNYSYPSNVFILISFVELQLYPIPYIMYFLEFTLLLCLKNNVKFVYGDKSF